MRLIEYHKLPAFKKNDVDSLTNITLILLTITRSRSAFLLCNINVHLSYFCMIRCHYYSSTDVARAECQAESEMLLGAGFLKQLVASRFFVFISLSTNTRTLNNPNEESKFPGSGRQRDSRSLHEQAAASYKYVGNFIPLFQTARHFCVRYSDVLIRHLNYPMFTSGFPLCEVISYRE